MIYNDTSYRGQDRIKEDYIKWMKEEYRWFDEALEEQVKKFFESEEETFVFPE